MESPLAIAAPLEEVSIAFGENGGRQEKFQRPQATLRHGSAQTRIVDRTVHAAYDVQERSPARLAEAAGATEV